MTEDCDYKLGELCFHPEKANNGILAIPCHECGICAMAGAKIVPNAQAALSRQIRQEEPKRNWLQRITNRKPISLQEE